MVYNLIISDIVLKDADESFNWYEERQQDAGKKFLVELNEILSLVKNAPELFVEIKPQIRKAVFKNYPYSLFFKMESEEIILLGIMHHKRNPSVIKKRIRKSF